MIVLKGCCFNGNYLSALKLALSTPRNYEESRLGQLINLGQAYFEIYSNDPRLIFLNERKINPVFAIIEAAWVISGSNKLSPLNNEVSDFNKYSDDGETLHGAYGYRLKHFFGLDQINSAVQMLKTDSLSRRAVLTMYAPDDLVKKSKDIPCNTTAYLKINNNALDITVLNRSNDLYLGVPYNVFIFGVLQRFISKKLGLLIGVQRHFSDNLHLYKKDVDAAIKVVKSNNKEAVYKVSQQFGWGFADAIIESAEAIVAGNYDDIFCSRLATFLSNFNKKNRLLNKENIEPLFMLSDNFYEFIAYQRFVPMDNGLENNGKHWERYRRLMMSIEIKSRIELLGTLSSKEIVQSIMELAEQLKGKLPYLKEVIEKKTGPFMLREQGNDEVLSLRAILLSAVLTTLDPYLSNTPIGIKAKQEINAAAIALDVPVHTIGSLSIVEDELFSVLSEILD